MADADRPSPAARRGKATANAPLGAANPETGPGARDCRGRGRVGSPALPGLRGIAGRRSPGFSRVGRRATCLPVEAVEACRFTVLVASSATRWDKLAQFAAGLAQHTGLEGDVPGLIIIARDFAPASEAGRRCASQSLRY